jgi:hypothetical protein
MPRIFLTLMAAAALLAASSAGVSAQKAFGRGPAGFSAQPSMSRGGGGFDEGHRGGYGAGLHPGVRLAPAVPGTGDGVSSSAASRRTTTTAAGQQQAVPDEVLIEVANSVTDQAIDALQRRHRLTPLESERFQASGTTLYRWRISDRRSVATVVRELQRETVVASVQPNYRFTLQ